MAEPNSRPNANVYANSHSWGLQAIPWIEEHKDDGMKVALGHTHGCKAKPNKAIIFNIIPWFL